MKIKRKVEKTLPQLIEWAWENDIRSRQIRADQDISAVSINEFGDIYTTDDVKRDDTFTVEVEEELTEDTFLDYLYALTNDDEKEIRRCMNFTIRSASMVIGRNDLTFFTLIDNDLVKIYENGKLVE